MVDGNFAGRRFTTALAADLPVRAPLQTGYPYGSSGFYFGLNSFAGAGSADVTGIQGVNSASLVQASAAVGGTLGYAWGSTTWFLAVEAMFDYTNFNGNIQGFSFGGPAAFEQRIKIGSPITNFLSLFPNLGLPIVPPFPPLPGGAVVTNIQPYLMAGVHEDDISASFIDVAGNALSTGKEWRISPSIGVGMMGQVANGVAVDVWAETKFASGQLCVGPAAATGTPACAKQGTTFLAGLGIYY